MGKAESIKRGMTKVFWHGNDVRTVRGAKDKNGVRPLRPYERTPSIWGEMTAQPLQIGVYWSARLVDDEADEIAHAEGNAESLQEAKRAAETAFEGLLKKHPRRYGPYTFEHLADVPS